MPNTRYELLPSLLRFPDGIHSERQLYSQFVEHTAPGKKGWHALFGMQHYFIPTRLLDWTTSFGIALHFALSSDEPLDNPVVWVLHPGMLNRQALPQKERTQLFANDPARPLGTDDLAGIELDYLEDYVKGGLKCPKLPLAVTPEATFPRLRAQRGRFTIHGRDPRPDDPKPDDPKPLEKLCPDSVIQVVISNNAVEEIRERISLTGIDAFSIFPDVVGLADFLRRRHGLGSRTRTKTLVLQLRSLWKRDLDELAKVSGVSGASTPACLNDWNRKLRSVTRLRGAARGRSRA